MNHPILASLAASYEWQLSLVTMVAIFGLGFVAKYVFALVPTFRAAGRLNRETFLKKMEKPSYAANQKWNRKWAGLYLVVIFSTIIPFCLTLEPLPWWNVLLDIVVILMVYDLFYYFTHRFLFHNGGSFDGPLMWMHAVHHRQHNPCKNDSSYIHPLEVAIGLGLYVATIFVLSRFMGNFHVVTIVITWVAFSEINLHNHNLWESNRFPFRYLNYLSKMHHNHHARFTGGNYATITLLYDWMFGTLDDGDKPRKPVRPRSAAKAGAIDTASA
jgi:sterol desaturase/sphingolipid hydroxylase (fatty acid hydroxylase superfamily)